MKIQIGNKFIGEGEPVFFIAEVSANHAQDLDIAIKSIKVAKEIGVDAIKFQTYTPDSLTIKCDNEYFMLKDTIWSGQTLYDLYSKAYTPYEWFPKLFEVATEEGIIIFSTPFDKYSVDLLEQLNAPAYKIASYEITDIPFIKYVASKNKPIFISTGIATLAEIYEAIKACKEVGNNKIILMKCTSIYPAPIEETNLLTIPNMIETFQTIVGLSDHTLGYYVPLGAICLGAKVIEKHFILDKSISSPDASFSLSPNEFKEMINASRIIEKALGKVNYELSERIISSRKNSRSLFVVKDVKKGEEINEENVRSIRPGFGLPPKYFDIIKRRKFKVDVKKGTPLTWDLID